MGLEKAKSLLKVKGEDTFLDFIAKQVCACTHARTHRSSWALGTQQRTRSHVMMVVVVTRTMLRQVMNFKKSKGNVRSMFMNSFSTSADTKSALKGYPEITGVLVARCCFSAVYFTAC